jgi:anti-sigma factor RsiW
MSHLDEGTLHALLDGELDLAEVSEIQIHLGTCVACGSRLQEVKQVLAEADRLVGAMEMPAGTRRPIPEPPRASAPRSTPEPDTWREPPVLLLPGEEETILRRKRWMTRLRWAAVIAVIVGGGKVITNAIGPDVPRLAERDLTSASPPVPPVVVSQEERRRADSPVNVARAKPGKAPSPARPAPPKLAAKPETTANQQQLLADTQVALEDTVAEAVMDTSSADTELLASREMGDSVIEAVPGAGTAAESVATAEARDEPAPSREEDELATRRAAAAALAELDRERRRERANAATAALPAPRPPEVPAAAEPAPRPPSLEQRAQIYLRIGLDEAAKQLGQPVHVIEGMTPEFIGLTRGQIPGTNSRRPVVRVVYLDSRGRMILLDQQRMDSGDAPVAPAGSLRWAMGDVMLYLRGEPNPEVLRSLRERVR